MSASFRLPVVPADADASFDVSTTSRSMLYTELQTLGVRWTETLDRGVSRIGGAGPSDHIAIAIGGETLMVPVHTKSAVASPFVVEANAGGETSLFRNGVRVARVQLPAPPRFYGLKTKTGVPYFKIATLHSDRVLATTVLQHCVRFRERETSCQFCAIGQSLAKRSGAACAMRASTGLAILREIA